MVLKNKFVIGTAGWRQAYGVLNQHNFLQCEEITSILDACRVYGVDTIDTALVYGDVVQILSDYHALSDLSIISKFNFSNTSIDKSLEEIELNKDYFSTAKSLRLLIHNTDFLTINADYWSDRINNFIIERYDDIDFGISIYTPRDLDVILRSNFKPKFIQLPICLGDQRWQLYMESLSEEMQALLADIEIHARSIFLQGSLLKKGDTCIFNKDSYNKELVRWWNYIDTIQKNPFELCVSSVLENRFVDKIVLGIMNASEIYSIGLFTLNPNVNIGLNNTFIFREDFLDIRTWEKRE